MNTHRLTWIGNFMTKRNIGRGIFVLIAIFFIGNGLMVMLNSTSILDHMLLWSVESVSGLSSIRALLGATIFATWASVLLGAIKTNFSYIFVVAINLSAVIFAPSGLFCRRLVSRVCPYDSAANYRTCSHADCSQTHDGFDRPINVIKHPELLMMIEFRIYYINYIQPNFTRV